MIFSPFLNDIPISGLLIMFKLYLLFLCKEWYKKYPPMLLTITSNRTVRHATIPPIVAPDNSEAPLEEPASVFSAAVVLRSSVAPVVMNVPLVCSVLMGKI